MLTDNELKEIRSRHKHEWDDGFEDIPLLIDEIERKHWEIVLLHQSLRAHAEKIQSLNAVIEALTDKLTAAGIIVDVKNAETENLRFDVGKIADECRCCDYIQRSKLWKIAGGSQEEKP